jgi:adenine-specific DNA methylase
LKDLFGNEVSDTGRVLKSMNNIPMNYIGNKRKVVKWIYKSLKEEGIVLENYNVFDATAGSGSFSLFCKKIGCKTVISNELLKSSYISNVVLLKEDDAKLSKEDVGKLLDHKGLYKELLDYLSSVKYNWFEDSEEKKKEMVDYVTEKSVVNKYLTFMISYCGKFFTLKECIELASFREYIDGLEDETTTNTNIWR